MKDKFVKDLFQRNLQYIPISNRAYEIVSDIKINEEIYLSMSNSYYKYYVIYDIYDIYDIKNFIQNM